VLSVIPPLHRKLLPLSAGFLLLLPVPALPAAEQKAQPKAEKAREIPHAPVSELIQRILTEEARLDAARNLSALAATPEEKQLAQKAIRLADHELGLAFLGALNRAAENPLPATPQARALDAQVKDLESSVDALQDLVDGFKKKAASARGRNKEKLLAQVEFQEAKLELAKDELAGAREDLIDAGGDLKSQIERLQADHQAAEQRVALSAASAGISPPAEQADTLLAHVKLWLALNNTRNQLKSARDSALSGLEAIRQRLADAERELAAESGESAAASDRASASQSSGTGARAAGAANQPATEIIESLRKKSRNQKIIAGSKLRIRDLTELAATYEKWDALETERQKGATRSLIYAGLWILLIVLTGIIVQRLLHRLFLRITQERRRLHTLQTLSRFGVQACCLALILLVVLGPPSQLATLVAFAGAGLTVALKDFIVSFIGWFMLMGRNGVHAGDWVEINGVCGEVIEVSVFHTVMLETGNWNDPGHPTGRKVTFTNSYAIEGHYFNFTSSGQWLWDELEFLIPPGEDPNPVADAVLQMVKAETNATAQLAEQEWSRVAGAPAEGQKPVSVSASPILNMRPTGQGVSGRVRYITRANERFEARARLYHLIVELLHARAAQQTAVAHAPQPPRQPS